MSSMTLNNDEKVEERYMQNTLSLELNCWQLRFEALVENNLAYVSVVITRDDGAVVTDTGEDVLGDRGENVLAYELTANHGLVKQNQVSEPVKAIIQGVGIEIITTESGELRLFCSGNSDALVEHISLTNGTLHSPSCELEITL